MGARTYAHAEADLPRGTLSGLFLEAVDRYGEATAFEYFESPDVLRTIGYLEAMNVARCVAAALEARGIEPGERVAILSENRPEWALADYGSLCSGAVDVPIYATLTAPQVAYILEDSGARLAFVSTPEQLDKVNEAARLAGASIDVVAFDPPEELPEGAVAWTAFLEEGARWAERWPDGAFRERAARPGPDDVATILYTSGTTGDPKGVMLTHDNVASNVRAVARLLPMDDRDRTASFLPLSHIFQRMTDYLVFHLGCPIAYPRSILTVVEDFKVIRPTVAVSVPRLYEKIYNGVVEGHGLRKAIVSWAVRVADRTADARLAGGRVGGLLGLQLALADRLVFSRVRKEFGGCLRFFVSGGAPLAPELARFFYAIGLPILEGYGLTETSPVTNVNSLDDLRIGTVGRPVPGTEIRIADDGEILVRGRQVMKGYYRRPDATAEVLDEEGWFHTGDVGEIDDDGFLRITDRKKDILVTAGGKNVAPQPIENRLKTNPYVEQAILLGDRRRYVVLLVVPSFRDLEAWARKRGIAFEGRAGLVADARVRAFVEGEVARGLDGLASFETPKRIALLPEELTIDDGTLTPTLKVRRRAVEDRYSDLIASLYEAEPADDVRDR